MLFTPKVELLFKDGSNPKHYCIAASIIESQNYGLISASEIQDYPEENNGFIIKFTVGDETRGSNEMDADLGTLNLINDGGFVEVEFYDESSNLITKKRVRTEEAQKDTRPI